MISYLIYASGTKKADSSGRFMIIRVVKLYVASRRQTTTGFFTPSAYYKLLYVDMMLGNRSVYSLRLKLALYQSMNITLFLGSESSEQSVISSSVWLSLCHRIE